MSSTSTDPQGVIETNAVFESKPRDSAAAVIPNVKDDGCVSVWRRGIHGKESFAAKAEAAPDLAQQC